MNELDTARAMAAGELSSPQQYGNFWLFDVRVSGSGMAYRPGANEHVVRPPEEFLTDEFLRRCAGLPVIWRHPVKGLLDSDEFEQRVVGTVFLPFIRGDEVRAIAKIFDADAAGIMATPGCSTSPGVALDPSANAQISLADGSSILIEGAPAVIDHLAILPPGNLGVWDRNGEPSGVRLDETNETSTTNGDTQMADILPEKIVAGPGTPPREDAAEGKDGDAMSKICAALDAITKRLDAWEAKGEKTRDDNEGKTAGPNAPQTPSGALPLAADEARRADESARAEAQSRADSAFGSLSGSYAPKPFSGETSRTYKVRVLSQLKRHSPEWKNVDLMRLDDAGLATAERQIYRSVAKEAAAPTDIPAGQLREVKRINDSGHRVSEFYGTSFIHGMKPLKRVAKLDLDLINRHRARL